MSNFIITFVCSILFFLATHAHENTRPESAPNATPYSKSIFPRARFNLKPELAPKSTHNLNPNAHAIFGSPHSRQMSKPKPTQNLIPDLAPKSSHNSNLKFGSPQKSKPIPKLLPDLAPKSSHDSNIIPGLPRPKPPSPRKSKPKPNARSPKNSKSKPNPKAEISNPQPVRTPKSRKNDTSPYQFANHFCLSRRLDVKPTFCLQVLRSGPTKPNDNQALLGIAADAAIRFGDKTIALLKNLSGQKTAKEKPDSNAAVTECISAYVGYLEQFKTLLQEAQIQAQLASYDSELAKLEINRCVKALGKTKDSEIEAENKVALDHASLAQSIADSIQ